MPHDVQTTGSDLVWPTAVPAEEAVDKVARRLHDPGGLTARLYHTPFLGLVFLCRASGRSLRRTPVPPTMAHVVVDLVGGRAFLSDPWEAENFTTTEPATGSGDPDSADCDVKSLRGPAPRIDEAAAIQAGGDLLTGVLIRRRRLDGMGGAELHGFPIYFGKPNWWVTGQNGKRKVEVVVDAISGRHYACAA